MKVKSIWLRRIHKWVGLLIGVQLLLWTLSGATMALLDMDEVAGGPEAAAASPRIDPAPDAWRKVQSTLSGAQVHQVTLRHLPSGSAYEVTSAAGAALFSTVNGAPLRIDAATARAVAEAAHPGRHNVRSVEPLETFELAVREHELPIWRVDFADEANSSYYVSGTTGELLERRNDSWRWWDLAWMLHIMDYSERSSFNHPLVIVAGIAAAWVAVTGFWLLFRTMWRHDFAWVRRRRGRAA